MTAIIIIVGIIFTFFIPGYVFVEAFLPRLDFIIKFPLYLVLSLLISTWSVYFVSLVLGFGRFSILVTYSIFLICLLVFQLKKGVKFQFERKHGFIFLFAGFIALLYFVCLNAGIFTFHNGYVVMSAENWQDTAMHMSITESISRGNFPPTAPYFSGQPLTYYYFVDFHASIIETLTGKFVPNIFAYLNPIFVYIFILSVYSLGFTLGQKRAVGFIASFLAIFYGNFMSLNFIRDLLNGGNFVDLLSGNAYTIEYGKIMSVSPMADYFLQNRPMMAGLCVFVCVLILLVWGIREKRDRTKIFFVVGFIASLAAKFQFFAFIGIGILSGFFILAIFVNERKLNALFGFLVGLVPGIMLVLFLKAGNSGLGELITQSFDYKLWAYDKSFEWKITFLTANFGNYLTLFFVGIVLIIKKKVKSDLTQAVLIASAILLFILPFLVRFTISDADMFKFFYLALVPICVIVAIAFWEIWRKNIFGKIILLGLFSFSVLTCLLNLGSSYLNKNEAYSMGEYYAGLWIRNNIPKQSVFMEMPTVHSAVSDIGGEPRVLSYITWPYTHGFNVGGDNVFSRLDDVKSFYDKPNGQILGKYDINYVYLGAEEESNYPSVKEKLDKADFLTKIYDRENVAIYKANL